MNKKLIVVIGVSAVLISACGKNEEVNNTKSVTVDSTIQTEETEPESSSEIVEETSETEKIETSTEEETSETQEETETSAELESRADADFRNTKWGDSAETVKKYEGADAVGTNGDLVYYNRTVAGYDAYLTFNFENDILYRGAYMLTDTYTSGGQYITHYGIIKDALTEKYGNPQEDVILNVEDQDMIDIVGASSALEYGYVIYRTRWYTDTTEIMLAMMSENYDISILLSYKDINHEDTVNTDGL